MLKQLIQHVKHMETEERGKTFVSSFEGIPVYSNCLWSNQQRECHSLHEISYRACFKPQLPKFFIEHLSKRGHVVYDPFAGRGTTMVETLLAGRKAVFNDINPVCTAMAKGRTNIPKLEEVEAFLESNKIPWGELLTGSQTLSDEALQKEEDLLSFFSTSTLDQLQSIRLINKYRYSDEPLNHLKGEKDQQLLDWVIMVCMHLLTGHSDGYFSVRSMPPNQAISAARQRILNEKHGNVPPIKDIVPRILKKTKSLLRDMDRQGHYQSSNVTLHQADAADTPDIEDASVDLIITSPPFLNVVDYKADNWLKGWFVNADLDSLRMKTSGKAKSWKNSMFPVFAEMERVLKPGGLVAFEVGDIRGGKILMEELVLRAAEGTYLEPRAILINDQDFTKTARCWNVDNLHQGTNTNRIVIFERI